MFDRFTDRAKKVMNLARQEAQRFNHEYLGTEHILLGLVQEGSGYTIVRDPEVGLLLSPSPSTQQAGRERLKGWLGVLVLPAGYLIGMVMLVRAL